MKKYICADRKNGFTLIEISIVLVIIGLLVGSIVVGRDLIGAAEVRAQISQIQQYQQAVNTFRGKYGYLPGDIPDPDASRFGFVARGSLQGEGDGNGLLEGIATNVSSYTIGVVPPGEATMLWVDLSAVRLIAGNFTVATPAASFAVNPVTETSSPNVAKLLPRASIAGNYINVYSDNSANYFGLSAVTSMNPQTTYAKPGITVVQASQIDAKIDDGMPGTGTVTPVYVNGFPCQASNGPCLSTLFSNTIEAAASTSCFDNGNVYAVQKRYSMTQNNGAGVNCALSFKFQ